MSFFGKIFSKIFPSANAAEVQAAPPAPAPAGAPAVAAPPPSIPLGDVPAILDAMPGAASLNWRTSIVDLLKLLGLDSSLAARKELANEILYSNGELFRVETKNNLACTKAAWTPNTQGHQVFGMGFSTDAAGGTTDSLFIAGGAGPGVGTTSQLARLDIGTFQPNNRGTLTGWPELTGTGNAELWGFFPQTGGTGARIAKLDKTNGAAL